MHICLANLDFIPRRTSGLAVYGERLALGLARAGHAVTVVTRQHAGLAVHDRIEGIEVYRVAGGLDWIGYAWRAGPAIARLQRERAFDIVHFLDAHFAYRYRGPYVASLFQSFRQRATADGGLPYHSNRRGLVTHLLYYHTARWLAERPAVRRATHLIASSHATAHEFMAHYGISSERVTVVPLGIELGRFRRQEADALRRKLGLEGVPVLLHVGFGTPRKGLEYLARAMRLLPPDVRLLMIGHWEEGYRNKFYRLLGLAAGRVRELGYIPDEELPLYYSLADVFVFPTLLEGFGYPICEALACETPVVTSDVGSCAEVLGPGGRAVPPRDPEALARALNELLGDTALRRRLAEEGRAWVEEHFRVERMVRETLEVYKRVQSIGTGSVGLE